MAAMDVYHWIDEATRGLCEEACARVTREILGHYEDAVADALQSGQTEDEARAVAMESLGSAKAAGREYRRTYLTAKEAKWLRARLGRTDPEPEKVRQAMWWAAAMGLIACWSASSSIVQFALLILITTGYFVFFHWAMTTRRAAKLRRQGRRQLAWALEISVGNYYAFVVILGTYRDLFNSGQDRYYALFMLVLMCVLEVYMVFRSVAFELKLRRLNYPDNPAGSA
ncbi:MAG: hypothetical protein HZB26_06380 [Candidatus Hydrogenedentes bacterium]|nr:hypothetical protein [Candidatus Hydrogenedentota bacterium]